MKMIKSALACCALLVASTTHGAPSAAIANKESIAKAQEKLQATYGNITVGGFAPGPVAGSYEVITNGKILYFFPESELLLFGEFLNRQGKSVTQERLTSLQANKASQIPLDQAIKIGSGERQIIEFTDPDCPFCRRYESYIEAQPNVTRYIFLSPIKQLHPNAEAKAEHIFCAEDMTKAFKDVFNDQIALKDLKSCDDGKEKLAAHLKISGQFGVSGTPTLVLGKSQVVTGFDQPRIAQFINEISSKGD